MFQFLLLFLLGIPIEITSPETGLRIYAIVAGIKTCKSVIKKRKRKPDKIVLLAKSETLMNSSINDNEFVLRNHVLKEYDNMKEEVKDVNS